MYCYTITSEKEEVSVMGSFDGWAQLHRLHKGNQWSLSVALPSRRQLEFRFLNRDGKWVVMPHYQHSMGPDGIANNFIEGAALINDNDDASSTLLGYTHSDFVTIQDIPLHLVEQSSTITESTDDWMGDSVTSLAPPSAFDHHATPHASLISPITLRRPSVAGTTSTAPFTSITSRTPHTPHTVDANSSIIPASTTSSYGFLSRVYNAAPPSSTTSSPPPSLASPRTLDPAVAATTSLVTPTQSSPKSRTYTTPQETLPSPITAECVKTNTAGSLRTLTAADRKSSVPSFKDNYSMKAAFRTASHASFKEASQVKGHYFAGSSLPHRRSSSQPRGADVERTLSAPVCPPLPLQDLQKSATAPQPLPEPAESLTSAHEYSTTPSPPRQRTSRFSPYIHKDHDNSRWSHAVEVVGGGPSYTPPPPPKKPKTSAFASFFNSLFKKPKRDEGNPILNQYRTKQAKLKQQRSTDDFHRIPSNTLLSKYRSHTKPQRLGANINRVRSAPSPPSLAPAKSPKRERRLSFSKEKLRNLCKVPSRRSMNGSTTPTTNTTTTKTPGDDPSSQLPALPTLLNFKQPPPKPDGSSPNGRDRRRSRSKPRSRTDKLRVGSAKNPTITTTHHDCSSSEESEDFSKTWTNRSAATAATTVTRGAAGGVPSPSSDKPLAVPYRGKIHIPELRSPTMPRHDSPDDSSVDDFRSVYTHFRDSRSRVDMVYGYGFDSDDSFVDARASRSSFHSVRPDGTFVQDYPKLPHMADLSSAAAVKSIYYY